MTTFDETTDDMPSVNFVDVTGPTERIATGTLTIDLRDGGRAPMHYRLARNQDDLSLSGWRVPNGTCVNVPWLFQGDQDPGEAFSVWVEIDYESGDNVIISSRSHTDCRTVVTDYTLLPALTVPSGYLFKFTGADERTWQLMQYGEPVGGNHFRPLDWHPDGYLWSSEHTRLNDVGITPDGIIAAHTYAKVIKSDHSEHFDFSLSSTKYVTQLAGENLNLYGGGAFFSVVCTFTDGKRGRYILAGNASWRPSVPSGATNRALAIGTIASPGTSEYVFPSGSNVDWQCVWGADGVPISSMPAGPSFQISFVEILLMGHSAAPTGRFVIKEFSIKQ